MMTCNSTTINIIKATKRQPSQKTHGLYICIPRGHGGRGRLLLVRGMETAVQVEGVRQPALASAMPRAAKHYVERKAYLLELLAQMRSVHETHHSKAARI